jgi:MULE transposase domain
MPPEVKEKVRRLTAAGVTARQIVTIIWQNIDHPLIAQDVYNVQKQVRLESLNGKTSTESLIAAISKGQYKYSYKTSTDGRVTYLFFAHLHSIILLNKYPEVLLLDCTYKTNRFKMPLLNIVGSTCTNKTFYISFCFMADETEESYRWALTQLHGLFSPDRVPEVMVIDRDLALLNAIGKVFPWCYRQLCIWHIEKNILVHTAK